MINEPRVDELFQLLLQGGYGQSPAMQVEHRTLDVEHACKQGAFPPQGAHLVTRKFLALVKADSVLACQARRVLLLGGAT